MGRGFLVGCRSSALERGRLLADLELVHPPLCTAAREYRLSVGEEERDKKAFYPVTTSPS